jgi:hypothetical protein
LKRGRHLLHALSQHSGNIFLLHWSLWSLWSSRYVSTREGGGPGPHGASWTLRSDRGCSQRFKVAGCEYSKVFFCNSFLNPTSFRTGVVIQSHFFDCVMSRRWLCLTVLVLGVSILCAASFVPPPLDALSCSCAQQDIRIRELETELESALRAVSRETHARTHITGAIM